MLLVFKYHYLFFQYSRKWIIGMWRWSCHIWCRVNNSAIYCRSCYQSHHFRVQGLICLIWLYIYIYIDCVTNWNLYWFNAYFQWTVFLHAKLVWNWIMWRMMRWNYLMITFFPNQMQIQPNYVCFYSVFVTLGEGESYIFWLLTKISWWENIGYKPISLGV